jgi:multiple sugar transport system substrate-binding protein
MLMATGSAAAKQVKLSLWFPMYGGNLKTGFDEVVRQFEKSHPDIKLDVLGVDVSGEKFLTAMAGGAPPDVIFPDGPQVVQWAYKNLLTPLDKYVSTSKVNINNFWGPSWQQNLWKGKSYALPWITDANAAMIYNKEVFNEVGLAKAPESLAEVESFTRKINKTDAQGNYIRFGYKPWGGPDGADFNTMYTYGWAFGADFYNEKTNKVALNAPKMIDALDWMVDFNSKFDYQKMCKHWEKYTNWNAPNAIISGRVGMGLNNSVFLNDVARAKKTYTDYGYGYIVGPNGGKSAWLGGWCVSIPANAKHRDQAWTFIKWLCYEGAGTSATYKSTGFLPALKTADIFKNPEPKLKPWINVLDIAAYHRPVSPAMPVMNAELNRIMPLVFKGKLTPKAGLDEANTKSQRELDKMLAKHK